MTRVGAMCLMLLFSSANAGFAAVDRLRIIVENNFKQPAVASVYLPHLKAWKTADSSGIILLPEPYGQPDIILVQPLPEESKIYGPKFNRIFPVDDGIISLRATPVTAGIRFKALELQWAGKPGEAATAFALLAKRIEATDPSEAATHQRWAYQLLAKKYHVSTAYIETSNTVCATPELIATINARFGKTVVRKDGQFTYDDFRKAAGMTSYSSIIGPAQERFFDMIEKRREQRDL